MRRFRAFRTGTSKSSGQDRQTALSGTMRILSSGLNGKLRNGGMLADGRTTTRGNSSEKITRVKFQKPGVPVLAMHNLGFTVLNWSVINVEPGATIGKSRKRPTKDGIWLEATGATLDAAGSKFEPPVVATIKMWGERGQEAGR